MRKRSVGWRKRTVIWGILILKPKSTPIVLSPGKRVAPATPITVQTVGASALLDAIPGGQFCFSDIMLETSKIFTANALFLYTEFPFIGKIGSKIGGQLWF